MSQLCLDIVGMVDRQDGLFTAVSEQILQLSAQFQRLSSTTYVSSTNTTTVSVSPPSFSTSSVLIQLASPEKFS